MPGDEPDPLRRRVYRHPPVIEAMCRLQWSTPIRWDLMTPGQVNERVRHQYPAEPKAQSSLRANLEPGTDVALQLTAGPQQQLVFGNEEENRLLVIAPDAVSAHGLSPYEKWPSLLGRFDDGLQLLRDLLPTGDCVSMVGLRFINRITIEEQRWDFPDYVNLDLKLPDGIPSDINSFFQRTEIPYPGENTVLALSWATVAPDIPGTCAFVLDLDFVHQPGVPISQEMAKEILVDLKTKEGRAFEALITEKLRERFVEVS